MNYTKEIHNYVLKNFLYDDSAVLQDDASFLKEGIIDSTGIQELIMFLEKTYEIKVSPHEMTPENLDSVNLSAQFVARKLANSDNLLNSGVSSQK
jgi:acyl carrier protein